MSDSATETTASRSPSQSTCAVHGHATHGERTTRRVPVWSLLGILFAAGALVPVLVAPDAERTQTLSITFTAIVLEALPFVMLGSLLGGLIEVFVSRDRIASLLPRSQVRAAIVAALLGILFPVCECAIIPVTRRLIRKGVPFSVAVAYLIGGPIVNPLVAASTAVAYNGDWLIPVTRLLCGFSIAVFIAVMIDELFPGQKALRPGAADALDEHACTCGHTHGPHAGHDHSPRRLHRRLTDALEHGADDCLQVAPFLIIGAFVAALSQSLVPRETFVSLASTPSLSILTMMSLAVLLNLCSEADAFVAASFRTTLPLSAQMAFLVLGPMLDLKLIAMYVTFVRKRALIVMITLMVLLVFGMTLTLDAFAWGRL